MLIRDILGMPLASMRQQKIRFFLTTLGVIFGAFVLAASLSIGQGVQDTLFKMGSRTELLRKIQVHPNWETLPLDSPDSAPKVEGTLEEGRRERFKEVLTEIKMRKEGKQVLHKLDRKTLGKLTQMDHVAALIPVVRLGVLVVMDNQAQGTEINSSPPDNTNLANRIVSGRFFQNEKEKGVLVSEFLLYRLGIRDEKVFNEILGKNIKLEFRRNLPVPGFGLSLVKPDGSGPNQEEIQILEKIKKQIPNLVPKMELTPQEKKTLVNAMTQMGKLPAAQLTVEYPIVGIFRMKTKEEAKGPWNPLDVQGEVVLAGDAAIDLFFRVNEHNNQASLQEAIVVADKQESVREVAETIAKMGLRSQGLLEHIERERMMYLMIFGGMTCVAAVAMVVAALGITNTMFMSVLERTREIGIMKAVGASNTQMLSLFLFEGLLIGLLGGIIGLILTWAMSFPGDAWIRSLVFRELKVDLKESLFVFPLWLLIAVPLFSILVTTLAALGPARRAGNIDPVIALRHD